MDSATLTAPGIQNHQQATPEDVTTLARIFGKLTRIVKDYRDAVKEVAASWTKGEAVQSQAMDYRNEVQAKMDVVFTECWQGLKGLPKNTVAPGKATPQTVALQFFNANINRDLNARITAADAKKINGRSFSV